MTISHRGRRVLRVALLSAGASIAVCTPALAQDTSATTGTSGPASGDIVVTAQRRSQSVKDVPIAIVAKTGDDLSNAGVTGIRTLQYVTPGLTMAGAGANSQPAIRGIRSAQTDPGNDTNIATYVDGIYQSDQISNNLDLPDVERVEVLKGPQGTLFGRNATGGAIRVFTRGPSFTPEGTVEASYGSFNEVNAKGFVTGPIIPDVLAASLSGSYMHSRNWNTNITTGTRGPSLENGSLRGKLLFTPTSALKVTLTGAYTYMRNPTLVEYSALNGNTAARLVPGALYATTPRFYAGDVGGNGETLTGKNWSGALNIDWDIGIGNLTSTSTFYHTKSYYGTDADESSAILLSYPIYRNQKDLSQELIFSSKQLGMAQITAGLYYYHANGRYDPLEFVTSAYTAYGWMQQKTDAYAAFGELTLQPVDKLSVIIGGRFSHEQRIAFSNYYTGLTNVRPATIPPFGKGKISFNSFTPRFSVRYTFDSGDNIYFTYSKGFKSGGFNISGVDGADFKPEKVDAYEVGLKTESSRSISANISAFYYNYTNQQVLIVISGTGTTQNAASSHIYGADASVTLRPNRDFSVDIGVAYLHSRFASYPNASYSVQAPCLCGNIAATGDLSGNVTPFSPDLTVSLAANYSHEFAAGKVDLSSNLYFTNEYYFDAAKLQRQPSYATLNARASFQPAGTNLTLYAYGKNITHTTYLQTIFTGPTGTGATYSPPPTYGVGAKFDF